MRKNVNEENLTYAELKDMVGSTAGMSRLPRPEKLEKSDEEVLFKVHQDGADITVYVKGYILFIRYFCSPCTPTKSNGGRTRNMSSDAPDKWEQFIFYNKRDVEVELQIQEKLSKFPVPDFVWEEWFVDQQINDLGVELDMTLARNAIRMDARSKEELKERIQELTELDNPNSVQQMKDWLADNGLEMESLGKKEVKAATSDADGKIKEVLILRQRLAKSSVSKYKAMENAVCADGRARGMFQFYGANRTGRFAGKIIQMQNLPQNHLADLKGARELVRQGNYEALELLYDDVPDTLSQLIRTAFIPAPGFIFLQADFSAIEARVLSWFAGEEWRTEVFVSGGDIYCASASQMFKVPVVKNGENGHLRQKGKIAELALGYGGSVGALKAMGALEMGLQEKELQPLVSAWRSSNPNIVKFVPHDYQKYAIDYIENHEVAAVLLDMGLGKTVITLTAIEDLIHDRFEVRKVLVVAPLRVARDTWKNEVAKWDHLKDLKVSVAVGTETERRAALMRDADIYVINRENLQWYVESNMQLNLQIHC